MVSLQETLDRMSVTGELYEVVDEAEKKIRCYACGHRCLIRDGGRGVCKVRYNVDGVLRVPHGYVGALQIDPIEKKPFNHLDPGAMVMSFGMLGCDLHCSYCFVPETPIVTNRGVVPISALFDTSSTRQSHGDAFVAFPQDLTAVAGSGQFQQVTKVFKHDYHGQLAIIKPHCLPELRCTDDHRLYATTDVGLAPTPTHAKHLTPAHFLAIPRRVVLPPSRTFQVLDVPSILATHSSSYEVPHQLTDETVDLIMQSTAAGVSSKALGQMLGKDPSYTRHIRSKVQRGLWTESRRAQLFIEDGRVRFSKERRPGIPVNIVVDEDFAILMGYFCAEGSILETAERPNSYNIIFAFGLHEANLAEETCRILAEKFGVRPQIIIRDTTLGVAVGKTSLALLIRALCGTGSERKVVPQIILNSPPQIASAFLKAYVRGDGHRRGDGKINITTKSRALAEGTAWLVLCLGHLPSIYENEVPTERLIEGRTLQQTPIQFSVVWYDHDSTVARKFITTDDYYLVPVRSVQFEQYAGDVYNLEVEHEHNYLANFLLVSNCQNWEISQHGRDAEAGRDPLVTTAHDLVKLGKARQVRGIASTYNEPLITSEWAVSVFKEARQAGLRTMFISNGNGTPEVINYLRPHLDGYKIDLKSMQDRLYRQLGGVLQHILDTIRIVKESGLWLEVVTLVIPGFNDSKEELWDAARYIRSVSPDIPWHVTAFHPDYRMTDPARTTAEMLIRAAEIGAEAGLNYVYAGNLPGQVGEWEHTHCPHCRTILIKRYGFYVMEDKLTKTGGKCPKCGTQIPGVWA